MALEPRKAQREEVGQGEWELRKEKTRVKHRRAFTTKRGKQGERGAVRQTVKTRGGRGGGRQKGGCARQTS